SSSRVLQPAQVVIDRSGLGAILAVMIFQNRQRPAVTLRRLVKLARELAEHPQVVQRARRFEAFGAESPFGEIERAANDRLSLRVPPLRAMTASEVDDRSQSQSSHVFIVLVYFWLQFNRFGNRRGADVAFFGGQVITPVFQNLAQIAEHSSHVQ